MPAPTSTTRKPVSFEQDIVKVVVHTTYYLKGTDVPTEVTTELMDTAPSLIGSHACDVNEVVVTVRRGNTLWSPKLRDAVIAELATHRAKLVVHEIQ